MKKGIKMFDVVALLEDMRDRRLVAGQIGTVVEILDEEVFEVVASYEKIEDRISQLS